MRRFYSACPAPLLVRKASLQRVTVAPVDSFGVIGAVDVLSGACQQELMRTW